ncbi:ATP-binding protein [Mycolicibacterium hodleri]|uniref:histidine kinase n=1 Tax=Mycolicibacterium hodleri TaxID=49897 RepID=A0A502EAA4_9MYCO|nr:ATP-binding protein [Mycolicibacterium hodleri]TPG34645.1 HAMP domain-containing protein [Mycolicibacterium hodleri]
MTAFVESPQTVAPPEVSGETPRQAKRPSRWSIANWPVRSKVLAIALVPLLLAAAFGGVRIYSGWTEVDDLRLAADRVEMVPSIEGYMAALDDAMLANSTGGDAQASLRAFDTSKQNLQRQLSTTDVVPDVRTGVTRLLDGGQALIDRVTANGVDLQGRITAYAPILLTAEDAVNGSVRVDDETIRADTLGLSRAIGARGQMMMQQLLVNLGGDLPEPELRTSMISLAGTEPSTLFGMAQVLGVGSPDAQRLQEEMVKRMAIMSDPAVPLVGNPDLSRSLEVTNEVASKIIDSTTAAVTSSVEDQANTKRQAAVRDSVIVGVAMLLAIAIVLVVARSLVRPLRKLRDGALKVAHEDLARELERVRTGGPPSLVQPLPVNSTDEIGQVAHAVDELHEQAVFLAGEQARLQLQVGDMFETLSRRSRSLVDQQLGLIDQLERNEEDPARLDSLFKLDHLAARMRRNGANLLVLAGSKVPRAQADPIPVAALVNAASSEVEDYTRVVTASVPESEVVGVIAGDLVHLLAELLDNALQYSPPTSQVRVSAVRTGNGGLVIEVSDDGLGMTDADLRVSNARLQSGGEVNPYTARHMGLFVVGRLAAQHGLVVRLRSTVVAEPNSGVTAGVFIPAESLLHGPGGPEINAPDHGAPAGYGMPAAEPHLAVVPTYVDAEDDHDDYQQYATYPPEHRNGRADIPVSLLPQRNPGASGISDIPSAPIDVDPLLEPAEQWAEQEWPEEEHWPSDAIPAQHPVAEERPRWHLPTEPSERPVPTDTSSFFAAKAQAVTPPNGGQRSGENEMPRPTNQPDPAPRAKTGGSIFDSMLSEWLIDDPFQLAKSSDLDWQTVWDHGWSAAAAAEEAPVAARTEEGLPMRQPGARLVPGAANGEDGRGGRNGGAHHGTDASEARESTFDTGPIMIHRDPEAVRSSIGSHFSGVHAGRAHARDVRSTDED